MNITAIKAAKKSAKTVVNQTPSIPKIKGSIDIITHGKIRLLNIDIIDEINPLHNAVKKAEPNIPTPQKAKQNEQSLKPRSVSSAKAVFSPKNIDTSGVAHNSAIVTIVTEVTAIMTTLFLNKLLSSFLFAAP